MNCLLLSAEKAAKFLDIGRSHFYSLHSSGKLGPQPVRLGGCTRWDRRELEAWVKAGCPDREKWQNKEIVQ